MSQTPTFPDLKDCSVFITGGGSGIGAEITRAFVKQGARVAFVQRSDGSAFCDDVARETGNRPLFIKCDITDSTAIRTAIAQATDAHGPVNVLVNNAANDQRHETLDVTDDDWNRLIDVNLKAYFIAAQAVIPGMQAAGGGTIINFTSISYMMGNAGYPLYVTANSGINGMTRALAREFGPDKIRVNALAPGWVMTQKQLDMWVTPEAIEGQLARQCLKETLGPEDITGGVLFLASNASRMMTGQAMVIDGGVVTTG
ncbi:NAD(P)-dependent dehydrogenase (short-subunit alcohol dehydrogenase family) [Sulfitobacter undariae]|uniref:NAD(P)-dependent dehydrogenase (Short-subunit alcohol dehydrogenase family) n=1 Tax=Sulfitobacter undariae TaxID=1563671 RepID=A0A7W6ECX5_9RHOB|nr:SDR family oxidoreductase [Sulfitobacter undariae]MBB3995893.1 NAD(P)-dependent dehydrogenase (short-subunit alcohol dehydrogenase family) [Sulfitobacter undariae]